TAQPLNVFRRFLFDDVQDVVHGDDSHHAPLFVHYGQREQVVTSHQMGGLLLIQVGRHADDFTDHDIRNPGARGSLHEFPQGDDSHQVALGIQHVDVRNQLDPRSNLPDVEQGLV